MAHIKAQDPIKGMSQEVRWMSLIINHNCRKTDLASKDGRRGDLGVEGEQPLFMSITVSRLAFYYYEKQLTFQETVSLTRRQKSILEMFNKS